MSSLASDSGVTCCRSAERIYLMFCRETPDKKVDEGFKLMPQAGLAVHEFVFYIYRYFE